MCFQNYYKDGALNYPKNIVSCKELCYFTKLKTDQDSKKRQNFWKKSTLLQLKWKVLIFRQKKTTLLFCITKTKQMNNYACFVGKKY